VNRPIDIYFMVGLPIAIAMVIGVVLISGRLKPEVRTRFERVLAGIFYPMVVIYWVWRAVDFASEGDWFRGAMMALVAVAFSVLGVRAVRLGRLAPTRDAPR
jgi:hypothetical protein